jgi:Fe-S cluster assembly ATP-binding protein
VSELVISDLHVSIERDLGAPVEIVSGLDLTIRSGEMHALMGPNGSGKSTLTHALMGRPGYTVTRGSATLDGRELLTLPTWERAAAGLAVTMQYPVEVPGVPVAAVLGASRRAGAHSDLLERIQTEADRLQVPASFLARGVNAEFSGGEQKRMETLQLAVLDPKFAVLDEIDSGLDVDALRDIAGRVHQLVAERDTGVIAITHYARLLTYLKPQHVHVFMAGRIVTSGGPELADRLEAEGYDGIAAEFGITQLAVEIPVEVDPFSESGF